MIRFYTPQGKESVIANADADADANAAAAAAQNGRWELAKYAQVSANNDANISMSSRCVGVTVSSVSVECHHAGLTGQTF